MKPCPVCTSDEGFEKRGDRRVYFVLDETLSEDTWNEGEITTDTFEDGEDILYCLACDSELRERWILLDEVCISCGTPVTSDWCPPPCDTDLRDSNNRRTEDQ